MNSSSPGKNTTNLKISLSEDYTSENIYLIRSDWSKPDISNKIYILLEFLQVVSGIAS